ncbi:hypothetical protein LUR56_36995 [Streptomyces sp. MT29]|nr:hypothetical protein [Streptomyces sp. MT29]
MVTRLLDPLSLHRRPGSGEALSLVSSDTYRVAGVSWSVVQQASTLTAILTSSVALLLISVPLGVGVIAGTVLMLVVMRRVSMPLEARGLAEQGSAARASEVATDLITGIRVVAGMNARAEAARRYRTASDTSRSVPSPPRGRSSRTAVSVSCCRASSSRRWRRRPATSPWTGTSPSASWSRCWGSPSSFREPSPMSAPSPRTGSTNAPPRAASANCSTHRT